MMFLQTKFVRDKKIININYFVINYNQIYFLKFLQFLLIKNYSYPQNNIGKDLQP